MTQIVTNDTISSMKSPKSQSFPVVIEHDENGWYAECPVLEGCYAQGDSYEDLMKNIKEVILLSLEDENIVDLSKSFHDISLSLVDVPVAT